VSRGIVSVLIDGSPFPIVQPDIAVVLPVFDPGTTHAVIIEMGEVE